MTHTKTPWSYEPQEFTPERIWAGTRLIAQVVGDSAETQANAALIVRAVNSHDKLVKALEDCADDLEAEINDHYSKAAREQYSYMESRYQRDMVTVIAARAALREAKGG
jgi:hypothetical protein